MRVLQRALGRAGYDPGQQDGIYGPATATAVQRFQSEHGLAPDGIVGPATWEALRTTAPVRDSDLEARDPLHGALGHDDVLFVQQTLAAAGFDPGAGDGILGAGTIAALRAFQQSRGLDADGILGKSTWDALGVAGAAAPPEPAVFGRVASVPTGGTPLLALTRLGERVVAVVEVEPGRIGTIDVATGESVGEPLTPTFDARPTALALADGPDGPLAVVAWPDGTVALWSLTAGGLPVATVPVSPPPMDVGAVARGGQVEVVASGADGHLAGLLRLPAGDQLPTHSDLVGPVLYRAGPDVILAALDETGAVVRHKVTPPGERLAVSAGLRGAGPISAAGEDRYDLGSAPRTDAPGPVDGVESGFFRMVAVGSAKEPVLVVQRRTGDVEARRGSDLGLALVGPMPPELHPRFLAAGERTIVVSDSAGPVVRLGAPGAAVAVPPDLGRILTLDVIDDGDDCVIAVLDEDGGVWAWSSAGTAPEPESEWRQPNPTLARDYWTTEDSLGYGAYARAISEFIQHPNTKPPLTIGIKGPWGAGKTSVMRMVQALLDPPENPGDSDWRFKSLALTDRGKKALTEGEPGSGREVETTTVKTVLDRAATAPTEQLDLSPPVPTEPGPREEPEAAADHDEVRRPTVWFNPWMYQTGEQLWAGLAHEIISQVTGRLPWAQRERFWLELNLRRVNREALRRRIYTLVFQKLLVPLAVLAVGVLAALVIRGLGDQVAGAVAAVTAGVSLVSALAIGMRNVVGLLGRDAARALPQMVDGPIGLPGREDLTAEVQSWAGLVAEPDYQTKAGFLYFVQTDMRHVLDLVATPERPLVVFIDDLDRCSPGVVTQTIEAVNLFLAGQFPHCIFVLAIEPAVVAAHIETAHKDLVLRLAEFDAPQGWAGLGWRFLEKIVQLPLALPPPSPTLAEKYVRSLFTRPGTGAETEAGARIRQAAEAEQAVLEQRRAQPRLADLPRERAEVEQRAREQHGLDEAEARIVADDVTVRRFASTYSDEDDNVRKAIVTEALALPHRNPREMKRLVNLFRFYALIVNERRVLVDAESQTEVFAQVARLAALTNRWPHLLNALGAPGSPTGEEDGGRRVVFEDLEDAADGPEETWSELLTAHGLAGGEGRRGEPEGLRDFLKGGPRVGSLARELL
ncbi:MAG TPA: peptidoglycan-binding protein [Acidimicrobiales bacterium]